MEKLPPVGVKSRIPYSLSIYPFLRDHRIPSGAVLPAVHSMQLLVDLVNQHYPGFETSTLFNATFGKLLLLPDDQESIEAWYDIESVTESHLRITLLTKSRSKSGITRSFPHAGFELLKYSSTVIKSIESGKANYDESIPVNDIYPGLVSFAEEFQNVVEPVRTNNSGAITRVSGGQPVPGPSLLGSPFPLDAAFQAACAWGRKYAGRICYPVALGKRVVLKPTQALEKYDAVIQVLNQDGGSLEFDLVLKNSQGEVMELVEGLKMREIGL